MRRVLLGADAFALDDDPRVLEGDDGGHALASELLEPGLVGVRAKYDLWAAGDRVAPAVSATGDSGEHLGGVGPLPRCSGAKKREDGCDGPARIAITRAEHHAHDPSR